MNEQEAKNMMVAFLKSGLSVAQATDLLKDAEKQAANMRQQQEMQQFQSGLTMRTFFALVVLVMIFLCFVAQQPGI